MANDVAYMRTLFSGHSIKIQTYMRLPSIYFGNGSNVGNISSYPVVMIKYEPPRSVLAQGTFKSKDAQFKMNPRNQLQVKNFFRAIYRWFSADSFKDLFILDEHTGKLMVNMEYRDLQAKIGSTRYEAQAMLAIPAVTEFDSVQSEGCALAINNTSYTCPLTDVEIESILGILEAFSFQEEAQFITLLAMSGNRFLSDRPPSYGGSSTKITW
jgi:hypothetical protein